MNIMSRNYLMEPAVTKLENVLEATLLHLIMSPVERKEHYVFGKNLSKTSFNKKKEQVNPSVVKLVNDSLLLLLQALSLLIIHYFPR